MFLRKHFGMFVRHLMGMPFENLVQKKKSFDVLDHVESFDLSMSSCDLKNLWKMDQNTVYVLKLVKRFVSV